MPAALLMLATLPGRTQGLGLVTEPLLADLHLDRLTDANLNLWATLIGALACFPTGWAIDRFGLRWVTTTVTALLGLTVWRILGQFPCGWLTTRYPFQTLTLIALGLDALGLGNIPLLRSLTHLWFVALLLGVAGGMIIVFFSVWSEVFGHRHLGRIPGAAQMLTVLSSGFGPRAVSRKTEIRKGQKSGGGGVLSHRWDL